MYYIIFSNLFLVFGNVVEHCLSCLIYYLNVVSSVRTAIYTRHLIYYSDWETTLIFKCEVLHSHYPVTCSTVTYGATLLWTVRRNCKKIGNLATICSGSQFPSSSIRSHSLQWRWISVWTGKQDKTKRLKSISKWLTDGLTYWLVRWLTRWRTDEIIDWLTDLLTDSDCLTDWLTDWLARWLTPYLSDGRTDRSTGWLTVRPIYHLTLAKCPDWLSERAVSL